MISDIKVTLQFSLFAIGLDVPGELCAEIDHVLGDWSDGRHPFDVEMIHRGVEGVVEGAIRVAIETSARKTFGDEMVKVTPNSETSRALIESQKLLKDLSIRCHADVRAVSTSVNTDTVELDGPPKWRVLCRDDRKPDGTPGDYSMSIRVFDTADEARALAEGYSSSRFPLIVEAEKAHAVLGALNLKPGRW